MVAGVGDHAGGGDAAEQLAGAGVFLDPERDESPHVDPTPHAAIDWAFAFARFRFEDLAVHAVHLLGADDRLLLPREEILDDVLIRQVAAEQRLFQVLARIVDRCIGADKTQGELK